MYTRFGDMMQFVNKVLWGIATIFLLSSGIYFSMKLHGIQFRLKDMIHSFKKKKGDQISPFETLTMATAARIGVGSLAGIALAIYVGGEGTIFWLWLSTFLVAPNAFAESCLGVIYREKDGEFHKGGPAYYIKKGLGMKKLSSFYALLIIIAYIFGFLTIQSNTIAKSLENMLPIPFLAIGIMIALISFVVIYKGVKGIADFTSKLVPIMGAIYLAATAYILIKNASLLPSAFFSIIQSAFSFKAAIGGFLGTALIGIQRGIFSNEAGIGTGAIASSTSDANLPVQQGLVQVVGIYFTSLVVCTATAFIILTSNYQSLVLENVNGIEITKYALQYHLGSFGQWLLIILIILFAFSTIITGYYYGESNLKFLFPEVKSKFILAFKILTIVLLILGAITSATTLWNFVDILVALLAIINIYALLSMRKDIIEEWNHYRQKKDSRENLKHK